MVNSLKDKNPAEEDYKKKYVDPQADGSHDNVDLSKQEHDSFDDLQSLYDQESKPTKNSIDLNDVDDAEKQRLRDTAETDRMEGQFGYEQEYKTDSNIRAKVTGAFAGRRKYGWIGGGLAGTIIAGIAILFPTLTPMHILNNYLPHNFEYNHSLQRDRTGRHIIKSIFNRNKPGGRVFKDTPFLTRIDLIDFEKFEARMQSRGWDFNYNAAGKPIGLIDPSGVPIDLDNVSRAEFKARIQPLIDDTIPAVRMNQRMRTRVLISTFTGPIRSFKWTKLFGQEAKQAEPDFDKRKFLKESGLDDIPTSVDGPTSGRQAVDADGNPAFDADGNPIYEQTPEGSVADQAREVVLQELDKGATKAAAITTAIETVRARFPSGKSVALMAMVVGCVSYQIYEQDLVGQFERYASALRIGSTMALASQEIQHGGDIDIGEVGQLAHEYNNELGSFAASPTYERNTGQIPTGPELAPELHVIEPEGSDSAVQGAFEGVGSFFAGLPGMGAICAFVNSIFFVFIDIFLSAVEVIAGCLVSACLATAGKVLAVEAVFELIGRLIAASLTNFVGFLITHPIQAANFLDQALSLIATEETRSGSLVDNETYNTQVGQYFLEKNRNLASDERYFSLDNPRSLVSKLSIAKSQITSSNPSQLLAKLIGLPATSLLAASSSGNVYAQVDLDFKNYGFQKYSYANSYLEVDPIIHAEEIIDLFDSGTSDGNLALDFAEKCMGYNHDKGEVDKGTYTKMLPQFSDPAFYGVGVATERNDEFQSLCIEQASAESDLYSSVGRFVSDLELATSIQELSE